jgi:hypothetical protein
VVGVFLEKTYFIPTRVPIRAFHLRKIREDPDRPRFPFLNQEFNLGLECLDFIAANSSDNLEPKSRSSAFPKSFNHGPASPFFFESLLQDEILIQLSDSPNQGLATASLRV